MILSGGDVARAEQTLLFCLVANVFPGSRAGGRVVFARLGTGSEFVGNGFLFVRDYLDVLLFVDGVTVPWRALSLVEVMSARVVVHQEFPSAFVGLLRLIERRMTFLVV